MRWCGPFLCFLSDLTRFVVLFVQRQGERPPLDLLATSATRQPRSAQEETDAPPHPSLRSHSVVGGPRPLPAPSSQPPPGTRRSMRSTAPNVPPAATTAPPQADAAQKAYTTNTKTSMQTLARS